MRTAHWIVHGRVQGVWFRGWTVDNARQLDLDGWVRNRTGGTVEIVAVGPYAATEALKRACQQGPRAAQVDRIEVVAEVDGDPEGLAGSGFRQIATL